MSSDEVQWFVDLVTSFGIELLAPVLALSLFVKLFLPDYLGEKAKNLATREDFNMLLEQLKRATEETERIKAKLSSRHWLSQQQWSIRDRHYAGLLASITQLRLSLEDRNDHFAEPGSEHDSSFDENEYFTQLSRQGHEAYLKLREQIGPASVFLSDKTIEALENLISEHWHTSVDAVSTAEYVSTFLQIVNVAYSSVLTEAQHELGIRQKET